jgi:hypothetical protein
MFLKGICAYVIDSARAINCKRMSSPPLSDAIFLFPQTPQKTHRFEVDSWADYALREVSYALSTTKIIGKIIHCKSTKDVAHDFLFIEIMTPYPAYLITDRGPTKNNGSLSLLPSTAHFI